MRDLKFRAYRNDMMSKPFTLGEAVCWPNGFVSTAGGLSNVMQYTGLKDRNGVEIYDGDIVEWGNDVIEHVFFDDGSFVTESSLIDSCMLVIGNIYQNPELFESQ